MKTYHVTVRCEQDGTIELDERGVPEAIANMLLAEAPKLKAAVAASKAFGPGRIANLLAKKIAG